jgi:hypothetical protein
MEAKELRIGNLIYKSNVFKPLEINVIEVSQLPLDSKKDGTKYEPILITEEWLLKFGFDKEGEWYTKKCWPFNISYFLNTVRRTTTIGCDQEYKIDFTLVENVHQLQNLYFALTGQELNYVDK